MAVTDQGTQMSPNVGEGNGSRTLSADLRNPPLFSAVRRGYDPDQVASFLRLVADRAKALENEIRRLEFELQRAHHEASKSPPTDPYVTVSSAVADLLRDVDQGAERIRKQSEAGAERVLAEARGEAERVRLDAQREADEQRASAERTLQEALSKSELAWSDLASRRQGLLEELRAVLGHVLGIIEDLEGSNAARPPSEVVIVEGDGEGPS
jgi:hypothetical protein